MFTGLGLEISGCFTGSFQKVLQFWSSESIKEVAFTGA